LNFFGKLFNLLLISNSLSATSETPGYEILNYWTDIKIRASKRMD